MINYTPDNESSDAVQSDIMQVISHDDIINYMKKEFIRLDTSSIIKLTKIIIDNQINEIEVKQFKDKYKSFIRKNIGKFDKVDSNGKYEYYLKKDIIENIRKNLMIIVEKIGTSIKDVDDDELDSKWVKSQIDGYEAYEVTAPTTFQDVREKICIEGKNASFRYSFKNPDLELSKYENKTTLQMIEIHVNNDGEHFDYPLKYVYVCPICNTISSMMEYKVSSSNNKHKCRQIINGFDKPKQCNTLLSPDINRTITKDAYIYDVTFYDKKGVEQKADAISFRKLPKGYIKVVLQKIPHAYGRLFVHIVDYQPIEKTPFELPKKTIDEHYIFTLINFIDNYIEKTTNYYHYGYLPMKIAMLVQLAAAYVPGIKKIFNISMTGERSSGKSQFARYWGLTLYSENAVLSNATSISIPKLRGTMESFNLFGKEHRYQYRGLLGEKKLIVIDEIKESPDVKNNMKQYLLEPNYEYTKQGSNNQMYERTAQCIVTQNEDTKHIEKYSKEIRNLYKDENLKLYDGDNIVTKPAWDTNIDLTLPLYEYKNQYLRYCVRKIRDEYERHQINWIDGSELALKQRFYFFFFLGSSKTNQELTNVIRNNNIKPVISNNLEILKLVDSSNLVEYLKDSYDYIDGSNDLEYFIKIDKLLKEYNKRNDARTKEMSYLMIKLIRILDKRNYCNEIDLQIFQYLLECIDNKIEVADTNEFKINGPHVIEDENIIEENDNNNSMIDSSIANSVIKTNEEWGYSSSDEFK